ncbi:MAG TPA: thioesterase family protein [Acidimicrobiales bacterium]
MALYQRDDELYLPTGATRGPWDANAQNGGAVSALVATAAVLHDQAGAPRLDEHILARLTVDLVRPVPLTPLSVTTSTVRPGRKVQLVEVLVHAGEEVVTRALGLRMPATHPDVVASAEAPPAFLGADTALSPAPAREPGEELFHMDGAEVRTHRRGEERPVPVPIWVRLTQEVVEGEPTLPAARALAAADFGSGLSGIAGPGWRSINVDVDVHLFRLPVGGWVCYLARSQGAAGVGLAGGPLYDTHGPIGHAQQSVLVEPWAGSFPPRAGGPESDPRST